MEGLTKVVTHLQSVIQKGYTNFKKSPKERITREYVQTRQELLEGNWSKFETAFFKLQEQAEGEVGQNVVDIYDSTEDVYVNYKTLMKSLLNKLCPSEASVSSKSPEQSSKRSTFVKLPKITIPIFSGKYSEWTTFNDLFKSLVHKNETLDDCQKLHYLKNHLTGEAEQLIRHTPISDANYAQCWDLLERRYNNKKYLAHCILNRLFSQKRLHVESGSGLKELFDTTNDCLNALKNLEVDVSTWDIIIIEIVAYKLDFETRKQWELSINPTGSNELPTFEQFRLFIENRYRALEFIEPHKPTTRPNKGSYTHHPKAMMVTNSSSSLSCKYCHESHKLCFCKKFVKEPINKRREFVAKNNVCFNCLGSNHIVTDCKKPTSCRVCHKRHHSLLHPTEGTNMNYNGNPAIPSSDQPSTSTSAPIASLLSTGTILKSRKVLLATALVEAKFSCSRQQTIRALLDQGSQACFITEAAVQLLCLKKIPTHGVITGLGNDRSTIARYMVNVSIQSRINPNFKLQLNAYVLGKITSYLPDHTISSNNFDWLESKGLYLADPEFNIPNKIDILLGADVYSSIIQEGMIRGPSGTLIAQNTTLGWILSGVISPVNNDPIKPRSISVLHAQIKEDDILKRFWEIEEYNSNKKILTVEEEKCEELYRKTTERDEHGRYVVRLPFREENPACRAGNSRLIAENRFISLEKRLSKNKQLKEEYTKVINEYLHLGHMRPVKEHDSKREEAVYLPHHAVIREDKTTTKVRIVFNASQKNNKGVSLNETLMVGPTLQADLRHTILKWRRHAIGLVADVEKMYRQVMVAEEDTMYQRILWRDNPDMPIQDYELLTVTFGTASAPYQAIRTLHQIAYDAEQDHPLGSDKVLNSFYVDDMMTGCNSIEEGIELYTQITLLLKKGGFILQKWNSNNEDMIKAIHLIQTHKEQIDHEKKKEKKNSDIKIVNDSNKDKKKIEVKTDDTLKTLGLTWSRRDDVFQYVVNLPLASSSPITKRAVISEIARLYDPLGWLAPCIIVAKILIQKLWLAGIQWDEELPVELLKEWSAYRKELPSITKIQIPRWLGTKSVENAELHGFCDASKAAYSAVIYLRNVDVTGHIHISLLVAKTRVAPIKQVSIPRLELCGAVLLAKLLKETAEVLGIADENVTAWTDSNVVLAWLNSHPSRWKTFVANRTSEILTIMTSAQWYHVSTKDNPADCASRGLMPRSFKDNVLWFSGPSFLKMSTIVYKRPKDLTVNLEESVKANLSVVPDCYILERFSTLSRLLRVIAYCRRFLNKGKNVESYLSNEEIHEALLVCIRKTQSETFALEYRQLSEKGKLQSSKSKLKSLSPYLDGKGIMRVRGRLERSNLDEQTKHPIVLPGSAHFTKLIIADAHNKTLHGGPQQMLNYLRTAYWIIGARNLVKHHVHKCVTCVRHRATTQNQLMGSLPTVRCTPARPFLHSGVDYAGPINIGTTKGRGHHSYKGYICLFVCMCTRAIHLEVVSDMSSQAFLAAFRRFVSRRGHCAKLWSDNGTTFVGASKELQQLISLQSTIAEQLEAHSTEWHFIPPHSPNFGGLWESGVKSTKFHLKRVIGESTLTYEELSTFLSQVEACLNSRPISVLNSMDPGEPTPLTPGHFLIGEPIISIPDYTYEGSNVNCLSRWQFVQRMLQSFWKRWSNEYLSNLMNRYKWSKVVPEPKIGDIVLIKEDDLPPSRWLLGRVEQKHPGKDNVTRVATVRTKTSSLKRPTSKLCILPIEK